MSRNAERVASSSNGTAAAGGSISRTRRDRTSLTPTDIGHIHTSMYSSRVTVDHYLRDRTTTQSVFKRLSLQRQDGSCL